jgi:cysteinyl-tRNA synthetase
MKSPYPTLSSGAVADLVLYNTRTRRKERFEPLEPGLARIYSCGPTVYSPQHIGNLRPYLFADLLKRALQAQGLRVRHVINVTDVGHLTDDADEGEDKMELAARSSGRRAQEIAEEYTRQWQDDLARLNCIPPDVLCRATEHIAEQIEMIQALETRGVTYRLADGLYFDTGRFPRYAEFARLELEQQKGGARIGEVEGKRHPADFALWKFPEPGVRRQQEWDSPWGRGFPGWHIECSAMSTKYLGRQFDIHTGGVEHVGVHHTNEIAQSETALDVHPWVRVWMHEDWIVFDGEKISKSRGNIYTLQDLVDAGSLPLSYRFFFLQAHYRKQQNFNLDAMAAADRGYRRLLGRAAELREAAGEPDAAACAAPREDFWAAVCDDLNAPRALALASEVARDETLSPASRRALLAEVDNWLGLDLMSAAPQAEQERDPRIDALVAEREKARARRDWAEADRIRAQLAAEGIQLEDTPDGPRWRRG